MKQVLVRAIITVSIGAWVVQGARALGRYGTFTGTLKLSPTGDGVHMRVLEQISYSDIEGRNLTVPPDFETDGASIPRALWSIVGSPFSGGNYVEAAVIHDEGCVSHKYDWQTTHRMFYEAMIDSGVSEHYAKLLYYGVRRGGPRWKQSIVLPGKVNPKTESEVRHDTGFAGQPKITERYKGHSESDLEGQIRQFEKQLDASETSGNPISIEQIDQRTASDK